ncbi:MAG TPA: HlyD family secretion protein [Bacteroidales bacterium]|nr:HlyD family secretion protein [Bacteroidales bacterium]HSA42935.1 HlyD family secretion protein [Bacteroidales bacterium]
MTKKTFLRFVLPAIIILLLIWWLGSTLGKEEKSITAKVKAGDFQIYVTTTGELEAKSSEKIYGPAGLRRVGIWQVKIENIIPEGTVVDSGAFVADLDRTEISNRLKDKQTELEKLQSQYTKTRLDTSLELRNARDELINLKYAMEEARITLEQSRFEPPATIRQVTIDLEKQERNYEQAKKNYQLKLEKAKANMAEVSASLQQVQRNYDDLLEVVEQFTVKAPSPGMVIYRRNWDGGKQGIGSTLSAWDNTVATLPDLKEMISKTYVNEIDISKVKVNQEVQIGVDAFPDKKYSGKVMEVANIGEQMRNTNAKVFEVKIKVNEYDSILRPAMTTKNTIITSVIPKVLFVPIEAIHNNDSLTYVFRLDGKRVSRQEVKVGQSNDNEIVITEGLKENDEVLLNMPEEADKIRISRLQKSGKK